MTMVPARNHLSDQHLYGGYVGSCGGDEDYPKSFPGGDALMNGGQVCEYSTVTEYSCLGSDILLNPHMAEDESTTNSLNEEAASTKDEPWLQLSIGGGGSSGNGNNKPISDQRDSVTRGSSGLVELDLLPSGHETRSGPIFQAPQIPGSSRLVASLSNPPYNPVVDSAGASTLFFQHPGSSGSSNFLQQEINWAFRSIPQHSLAGVAPVPSSSPSTSSASSSFLPLMGRAGGFNTYFGRPLIQFQGAVDVAGPSSELRIISPPRRPHSGVWFKLKALENQAKEPFLPQISKNYLRIRDGKMTVRLVMKYLVNKLSLESESEIEIRCRGQNLVPFLTLEHVRDNIWSSSSSSSSSSSRDSLFSLQPHSSTTDHLMLLHYGRIN